MNQKIKDILMMSGAFAGAALLLVMAFIAFKRVFIGIYNIVTGIFS